MSAQAEAVKAPKPKAAKTEGDAYVNPLALKGKGSNETIKVKDVHSFKALQARVDVDGGSVVDEVRAQQFAEWMKGGDKFPRIKVVVCKDAPGHADQDVYVVFDGNHTLRGAEIAKLTDIDAVVWKGTFAQAMMAAATLANREHEKSGKPLSNRDKIRSVHMAAKAIMATDLPKKDWPSNRALAAQVGCSHTLVGDEDPFGRRSPEAKTKEQKLAEKATARVADAADAKAAAAAKPAVPTWSIVNETTGKVVGTVQAPTLEAASAEAAKVKRDHPVAIKPVADAPPPPPVSGSVVGASLFDWQAVEGNLGYLIRGVAAANDLYGLAKADKPAFDAMIAYLDKVAKQIKEWRAKHGKK